MSILEVSVDDQFIRVTGDTGLLEIYEALPTGLYPPFPAVELPGGVAGLIERGGFGQTFFFPAEVLGVTLVTSRGDVVQAGGRVVKNVQGYDLVRPIVGSFGMLGTVRDVTLRLRPGMAFAHLVMPGALQDLPFLRPRFVWSQGDELHLVHFGAPRIVEQLRNMSGTVTLDSPVDYRNLFPAGMGVAREGGDVLQDLRFGWLDGTTRPEVPVLYRKLLTALNSM